MPPSLIPKNCSSIRPSSSSPSSWNVGATRAAQQARSFSATNEARTRQRRTMFRWLSGPGANFNEPQPGSPVNYLGSYDLQKGALKRALRQVPGQPLPPPGVGDFRTFPRNDTFKSEMVTGDGLREAVWTKVMLQGFSVKEVSAELGIEMSRVGAIVRLKEVEKEWQRQGKRLVKPYSRAIMQMLPQHDVDNTRPFESINDLPVHAATQQQIFHPTSESRHFTREDAARVFADDLLPADKRVPHPELIQSEKELLAGVGPKDIQARAEKRSKAAYEKKAAADMRRLKREAAAVKVVPGVRWDFKFRNVSIDDAGSDGRGLKGTGWRYGVPLYDRRKGEVKIPTKVV